MPSKRAQQLGKALRLLRTRGFRASGNQGGIRSFDGQLECKGGPVRIEFSISDWNFLTYPQIKVLDCVDALPPLSPHVYADGYLCYFASGSVVLDRYDPAESIAQCLDQAQLILERIREAPNYRQDDVQGEFLQHWAHGESHVVIPVLFGTVDPANKSTNYWVATIGDELHFLISDSQREVETFVNALGGEPPKATRCPCWLFKTELLPAVPSTMPATVKELFTWLKAWDRRLYHQIQNILERERQYLEFTMATFAVATPLGWLGFGFDLDQVHRLGARKQPRLYRQWLHGRGGDRKINRLSITEFGPDFVHSRNLTFPDLRGKRIVMVGCGAIGSQVAPGLVRLGAGIGTGRLELIDHDSMNPANLGRHFLGYPSLFKHKAQALANELIRQFPFATVVARAQDVRQQAGLFDADLVIDATGEEAVSELINGMRLDDGTDTPVLHVRIRGNGEAVQTYWAQSRKLGCFRCLLQAGHKNYREERYPLLKEQPTRKQLGCAGFTPYAVSAPMSAASLCMEVVVDWLREGHVSPTFRTRSAANANVYVVKDQDVTALKACPACGASNADVPTSH